MLFYCEYMQEIPKNNKNSSGSGKGKKGSPANNTNNIIHYNTNDSVGGTAEKKNYKNAGAGDHASSLKQGRKADLRKSQPLLSSPAQPRSIQSDTHSLRHHGRETAAKARERADAIFASTSSQWYAGAAFDRSPATHMLPHPTRLLAAREQGKSHEIVSSKGQLAKSCPQNEPLFFEKGDLEMPTQMRVPSPETNKQRERKGQDLLWMLRSGVRAQPEEPKMISEAATAIPSDTRDEQLEEMSRHVRLLRRALLLMA